MGGDVEAFLQGAFPDSGYFSEASTLLLCIVGGIL